MLEVLERSPGCWVITARSLPLDEIEGSKIIQLPWLPPRMQPPSHLHVGAFGHVRLVCFRIVLGVEVGSHTNLLTFRQQQRKDHFAGTMSVHTHFPVKPLNGADEYIVRVFFDGTEFPAHFLNSREVIVLNPHN